MRGTRAPLRRIAIGVLPNLSLAWAVACRPPGPGPVPPTSLGERPPKVVVSGGGRTLELSPFTWCWAGLCAGGRPPADPPSLGSPRQADLRFPVAGWTFSATFAPVGAAGGDLAGSVTAAGSAYRIVPPAAAGDHRVIVFGSGPGGDVAVAFRWTVAAP
jgi:hypothetical protein